MKHRAFTLVEVVIIVAIFAILLIPISNVLTKTVYFSTKSAQFYDLSQALTKAYEDVSHMLKDQNPNFTGSGLITYTNSAGKLLYHISYNVSSYDLNSVNQSAYSHAELKKVVFTITEHKYREVQNITYYIRVIK